MVKKKLKTNKLSKRRVETSQEEDVKVNTGLPPQVEGQLRCFCRLSITQITWQVPNTPDVTLVRMKWWGEPGEGVLFRPLDIKNGPATQAKTTARYAVRSGPKQFSSYLNDMGSLILEILSGAMHLPIGTVEVPNIGVLSLNRPINGLYPVISPTEEKIGELHVSMMIESLMASYDSTGSIPTTDLSMETQASHVTQESTLPKQSHPLPHTDQPKKPEEDPFISPASHHQNAESRISNGYAEDLRQTLRYDGGHTDKHYRPIENGSTVAITTNGDVIRTNLNNEPFKSDKENYLPSSSQVNIGGGTDLLSVLLNKGNKLREQMIISSLESKSRSHQPDKDDIPVHGHGTSRPDPPNGILRNRNAPNISLGSNDGSFLREILKNDSKINGLSDDVHLDEAAVDLVFGGQLTEDIRMLKNLHGSPNNSISGDDDILSDNEDPIHSESILNELFYKNPASSDELSELSCDETRVKKNKILEDESNMRPPSRSSSVSSLNLAFPPDPVEKKLKAPRTPKRKSRLKLRRKGSKKRKGSRSRSRASASECSDSEALSTESTPRSESSRVSFDMVPSDIEEPPTKDDLRLKHKKSSSVDGLSVERLTLLGRVHVARVTIENLNLIGQDLNTSKSKPKLKAKYGLKPPRPSPKAKKSCTYFIEYQFPVVATSRDKYSPNAMATEVMRVVSRNEKNGVVNFNHRSVFPVMFDGSAVERWWKYALVFKVFARSAGQKVPNLIGSCGIPLKTILKSESLHIGREIDVKHSEKSGNTSLNGSRVEDGSIGSLKIIVELASDSRDFPTALARTKLAEMTGKAKIVPIAQSNLEPSAQQQQQKPPLVVSKPTILEIGQSAPRGLESRSRSRSPVAHKKEPVTEGLSIPAPVSVQHYHGDQTVINYPAVTQQQEGESMTLHALLLIPDGRNITMQGVPSLMAAKKRPFFSQPTAHTAPGVRARDLIVRNTYLVCRMFWCDESVHSAVCWGTSEPQFKFQQVAPVLLSPSLLERLKNNFMIVEVWDKKTSADNDKLVGIVKLSLHQFYISFRDKRICSALLKSQYPVIAVENYLPIVDLFSGSQYGQVNVLLAMGSAEQIAHLMRMKTEGVAATAGPERPQHYLERQDLLNQNDSVPAQIGTECVVEHVFEIVVEGVRGLNMFENMIWGEADCFVQYHFPAQQQTTPPGAPVIRHAVPTMKSFRTATTLCVADPTFNDVTRHRILLPQGTPVQRELLTACANSWGGANGLPFELWARYYHPNVRDQCIAKSSLPLAKLCAMITMQKRGESSVQTFSFPLSQVLGLISQDDVDSTTKPKDTGLIDITVHYKSQVIQNETSVAAANKNLTGAQVCINVGILKACGLKAAAEHSAHLDHGMQFPAEVGVNAYVRAKLSFLGNEGERITRTIARSFAPEFSHFMDFPCPLLWTEADSEALCLAELLETAEATFEVWHQVPGISTDLDQQLKALTADNTSGRKLIEKTGDVLLGSTTIPLVTLLSHRTGINGWFPVNIPVSEWKQGETENQCNQSDGSTTGLQRVGGGLELAIKFAHHEDRERLLHAARGVGWSPTDLDVEQDEWESEDEDNNKYHHINITIDHVNFPVQNALIAGQNTLDKTAKCYVRYKFYDKAAVMTKLASLTVNSNGYITSQPRNKHDLQIPDSSMFRWYLREEKLEVQVWVSYGHRNEDQQRPKHRDKLIGTSYITMETLCDPRRKQHRVSGMYPLYKLGAVNLGGGYIRAHLTARPQFGRDGQSERQEGLITIDGEDIDVDYDPDDSFHQIVSHKPPAVSVTADKSDSPGVEQKDESEEKGSTFMVMIQVERALHLPLMRDKQKSEDYKPNSYVSYQTSESTIPSYTTVFHNSDNPVWDHEHETKLSTEMLVLENKHLVFKVWHKPDGAPKSPDKLTDRVLGFVSVDLTPLSNGLQQICGWYNVMDFNGQVKGQIKINVIPQESVISGGQTGSCDLYPTTTSLLSLPALGNQPMAAHQDMLSLPTFGSQHINSHYEQVKQHHELLQRQLQEHIQQFLRQQEESQSNEVTSIPPTQLEIRSNYSAVTNVTQGVTEAISSVQREPSIHWRPSWPDMRQEESASRSYLFSSLRKNLQDLDEVTNKLKSKLTMTPAVTSLSFLDNPRLTTEFDLPASSQTGIYPLTSTQSTISSIELPKSRNDTPRDELAYTGSQGGESSRTAIDSGAFLSTENSNEKYDDSAPISQRSVGDNILLPLSSVTPREFLLTADSGINQSANNSNNDELGMGLTLSPKESHDHKDLYAESGGFNFRNSPRDINAFTPRDSENTPRGSISLPRDFVNFQLSDRNGKEGHFTVDKVDVMSVENSFKKSDPKKMSIIQEFPEHDGNGSEDEIDNRYYHRYRDMLDTQEMEEGRDDADDDNHFHYVDDDEGEIVVPRRINDVSGKFSPVGEITSLNGDTSNTVPYGVTSLYSSKNSVPNKDVSKVDIGNPDLESDSETEIEPRVSLEMTSKYAVIFDEKDSWLSDSDKEEGENGVVGYQFAQDLTGQPLPPKTLRQDSDTGYSSRDNVSESYLTPSGAGTNSETDMSHLNEQWEQREISEPIGSLRMKHKLLSNVELESTGGSFGLKTDSGHHSRISSAESRHTRMSSVPSITESYEHEDENHQADVEAIPDNLAHVKPLSARSEELEDFFNSPNVNPSKPEDAFDSNSEGDIFSPRDTLTEQKSAEFEDKGIENGSSKGECNLYNYDLYEKRATKGEFSGNDEIENNNEDHQEEFNSCQPDCLEKQMKSVPNFFMQEQDMAESLKTLQLLSKEPEDPEQLREKASAASEMLAKLTTQDKFKQQNKPKTRLPTAEETKRIAKIFSSKFST